MLGRIHSQLEASSMSSHTEESVDDNIYIYIPTPPLGQEMAVLEM